MGVPPPSLAAVLAVAILAEIGGGGGGSIPAANAETVLGPDFYARSCPSLERIVRGSMAESARRSAIVPQAVLRLFFHDCFVEGCDASVLIRSSSDRRGSSSSSSSERDSEPNLSLAGDGFEAIERAKALVELACPGIVSCADVVAIAARDAVVLAGGPTWRVLKGRRDGKVSSASRVPGNLPKPSFNVDELRALFAAKGLDLADLVALSGAHTLGFSHCGFFADRLYRFGSARKPDPSLDAQYAFALRARCPPNGADADAVQALDPVSPFAFDNSYYEVLRLNRGLLASDQALWTDPRTQPLAAAFASNQSAFFASFASAMVKLGSVGVKAGPRGEIRRTCTSFNS